MAGEWIDTTIGEQATLQRGVDITKADQRSGAVPVISSGGVSSYHDTAIAAGPGVILGRKGVVGSVYYVTSDYWPHDTTLWVKDFHGNDRRFVYYFFRWMAPRIARMDVGSANPTLNRNHVHPIEIRWPPIPEQRAIAYILGTLDDKIELYRRMIETLEDMARALFKSWFVDFDPVRAKAEGRAPGLPKPLADLFPARLVDSEQGEIPEGWGVDVLENTLIELETGGRPKGGVSGYSEGVPSIGAESIVGLGIFDYSKTKYVPRGFFDGMAKGHMKNRDVLLYKDGGRPGEFEPHVTLFGDGFPFSTCVINEHVYRLRAKPELGQNFLFFWLSSDVLLEEMRIKGTGVAIPGLNSTQVRSLTTLVPAREATRAFDAIVEPWIARVLAGCNETRTLAALRDTLLPKLISGELRATTPTGGLIARTEA